MSKKNIIKVQAYRGLGDLKGACMSLVTHLYLLIALPFLMFSLLPVQIMLVLNFLKAISREFSFLTPPSPSHG